MQLPSDLWKVIVGFDECYGLWIGVSLRRASRLLDSVVRWSALRTAAGRRWVLSVLNLYVRDNRTCIPAWLVAPQLADLFAVIDPQLVDIAEAAAERDDLGLLRCVYGDHLRDPAMRHYFIQRAVQHGACAVVWGLVETAEDVGVACVESMCNCLGILEDLIDMCKDPVLAAGIQDCVHGAPPTTVL